MPHRQRQDLYRPELEHDSCGVAFVADLAGRASHGTVKRALEALCNLEHRGASGSEANTGDGAGILVQVPDGFLRAAVPFGLPEPGAYATGLAFLPREHDASAAARESVASLAREEGFGVLGWRGVPTDDSALGAVARSVEPRIEQLFVEHPGLCGIELDRRAWVLRKRVEHELEGVYFPSLSCRTMVYKGMLTAP
ncbi:MAG: glutamate synthase subunit alpha, partial [Acidimicrobiales bacterium]